MKDTQAKATLVILLSSIPLSLFTSSIGLNQLTTITSLSTNTVVFTSTEFFTSTWTPDEIYSGTFKIPQLSPPVSPGSCSISGYNVGPFSTSNWAEDNFGGFQIYADGITDYGLKVALWPNKTFDTYSAFLNMPPGLNRDDGCELFQREADLNNITWNYVAPNASLTMNWLNVTVNAGDYDVVLVTDGLKPANVFFRLTLTQIWVITASFNQTTTATSTNGYWVGQASLYPIIENAYLIAASLIVAGGVVAGALVLRHRGRKTNLNDSKEN